MSAGAETTDGIANVGMGGSRKNVLTASPSKRERINSNGYSQDEVLRYVISAFDGVLPMTLRDAYSRNNKYPWDHFLHAASQLVAEGSLEGKGDGFEVQYYLTSKGRNAAGPRP